MPHVASSLIEVSALAVSERLIWIAHRAQVQR